MYEEQTNCTVEKCGLFVDQDNPFLGASLDGLIADDGLIKVKCLHSVKDLEVIDHVKTTHDYYHQVQGQLNITGRQWCDFVVFTRKGELYTERIKRDASFWEKVVQKLRTFYLECVLPEIVDSRMVRGLKIRDPLFIVQAQKKLEEKKKKQSVINNHVNIISCYCY
jgi:hypothetical protein